MNSTAVKKDISSHPYCMGCIPDYLRSDGVTFTKGDWIEVNRGIGKFRGIWENPVLGITGSLDYFRDFSNPSLRTNLFFILGDPGDVVKPTPLDSAFKVTGPLSSSGKRPTRILEREDAT